METNAATMRLVCNKHVYVGVTELLLLLSIVWRGARIRTIVAAGIVELLDVFFNRLRHQLHLLLRLEFKKEDVGRKHDAHDNLNHTSHMYVKRDTEDVIAVDQIEHLESSEFAQPQRSQPHVVEEHLAAGVCDEFAVLAGVRKTETRLVTPLTQLVRQQLLRLSVARFVALLQQVQRQLCKLSKTLTNRHHVTF